ncbi:hypothetical protein FS837_004422 [Tulasnella sp. UAMH 9824]|nr:hypothetical protein FS837_004422 [Tulasnella sp. UAMH 9824]
MPAARTSRPASHRARPSSSLTKPNPDPGRGKPILRGYLDSLSDALIVIEVGSLAAMRGLIGRVVTKPNDTQKELYTQSGNIIVFEESEVGIRRWTDPLSWSETRACPPYFIYRETTSDIRSTPYDRSSRSGNRGQVRSRGVSFDVQRLVGAMPTGKRCRNSGHVMEDGMCKRTITIELPERKWHIISYYYVEDILSGKLMRPSEMVSDKLKQLPHMIPVGDLIGSISEELLDDSLYSHKGRNCLLLTERGKDGRLVYAGETDEGSARYKRRPLTIEAEEDEDEVHEYASSSATHLTSHDALRAAISHHPPSSWTGRCPQAPYFSSEPSKSSPTVSLSPPSAYFNAVQDPPASSPSSCSITSTLASFSGQGWELDDAQPFPTNPTAESWAHQHTPQLPPCSDPHSSLSMLDVPDSSSGASVTAWPLPTDSNLLWGESQSFRFAPFDSSSDQASYQLQAVGELDDASASFGQFGTQAEIEQQIIAGMGQATQLADTWWNGVESVLYGDAWNQTSRN